MITPKYFYHELIKNNISFFSGVPDSLLKNFCFYVSDSAEKENHIIAANEGNALSLGIGYHLATNKTPLIYMQNSGLGNIINPLLSLADSDVYSIPMLLMIGWRGEPGLKDEPQHKKQGRVMLDLLKAMEIPFSTLSPSDDNESAEKTIKECLSNIMKSNSPHALIIKKGTFLSYTPKNAPKEEYSLNREDAIKLIIQTLKKDAIVVSTTGFTSRELFECRENLQNSHKQDFLTIGGMGHASQIALAIAMQKHDKQVFCFDGDGAVLMHMGSLAVNASMDCKNFKHIVFNNGSHESVGGQPTLGYDINLQNIAKSMNYSLIVESKTKPELSNALKKIKNHNGSCFLEIKIKKGYRKNLGRPTTAPKENKKEFMTFVKS